MTTIPGDPSQENNLPGIDCPDPAIYLSGNLRDTASNGGRRRRRNSNRRGRSRDRRNEDRDRADRIQAALLLARRMQLGPEFDHNPFDISDGDIPIGTDATSFLEVLNDAPIQ